MFKDLVSWPDDDHSLGSKLAAIQIKLFINELVVMVNICRYCVCYTNRDVSNRVCLYFLLTFNYQAIYILWYVTVGYKQNIIYVLSSCVKSLSLTGCNN
jgi:hypothetical protein